MPEVTISIGGRQFDVACQEGEQPYLKAAAGLLDQEAQLLNDQIGRMPELRMLLMAGLMLADKTAGLEEELKAQTEKLASQEALIEELRSQPRPPAEPAVAAVLLEQLEALVETAEALADSAGED